jgi:serralysin
MSEQYFYSATGKYYNPREKSVEKFDGANWDCYVKRYSDLQRAFGLDVNAAMNHYNTHGKNEGRNPYSGDDVNSGGCKQDWNCYLKRYPDLQRAFGSDTNAAMNHYITNGKNEGRNPYSGDDVNPGGCNQDWNCYVKRYPDLQRAFGTDVNAARNHYNTYGRNEGRNSYPGNDVNPGGCNQDWNCYLKRYPDLKNAFGTNTDAARNHYNTYGRNESRNPYGPC